MKIRSIKAKKTLVENKPIGLWLTRKRLRPVFTRPSYFWRRVDRSENGEKSFDFLTNIFESQENFVLQKNRLAGN